MSAGKKHLMIDSFEIKGSWYLPGHALGASSVEGILKYSPDSIELELIGVIEEDGIFTKSDERKTIFGFSDVGEWLTLCDCFVISASISAPGFETQSYAVGHFYVGTQLIENGDDNQFSECEFSLTYIDAWINFGIMERRRQSGTSRTELIVDLNQALPEKKTLNNTLRNISICEEVQFNIEPPKDFYINETTSIKINRFYRYLHLDKSKFNFKNCRDNLNSFCYLLTVFVGAPIYFTYIDFKLPPQKELHNGENIEIKQKCRVFFNQVGDISKKYSISKNRAHDMVIYREDILTFFDTLFDKWFNNIDKLSEIVNPYVSGLDQPKYLETKFLDVASGLETFHRFFIEHSEIQKDDSEDSKVLEAEKESLLLYVKENISEVNRDYFIQRINYGEEKNLRRRLNEIFELLPQKLMERLFGPLNSGDKKRIISSIIDTRNYYTHRDSKGKYTKLLVNWHELYDMVVKLEIMLQYHLFCFLEIPSDTVVQRLLEYRNNQMAWK